MQEGPRSVPDTPSRFPAPGAFPVVCALFTLRGGWVGPQARPRHARRQSAGGWAGRMGKPRHPGRSADSPAPRPSAHRDPLTHPVAITEHCVIGDQIRVPAAWCDMAGCGSRFADPAALGEADNRARALAEGWGLDVCGRLVCPACQQRHRRSAEREMIAREPETGVVRTPAGRPAGQAGGQPQTVRPLLIRWRRAVARGRQSAARWPRLFLALATGSNGWAAPHCITVPDRHADG
jgi:hypothetical protein